MVNQLFVKANECFRAHVGNRDMTRLRTAGAFFLGQFFALLFVEGLYCAIVLVGFQLVVLAYGFAILELMDDR